MPGFLRRGVAHVARTIVKTLIWKYRHFNDILVTSCIGGCHVDHIRCGQWQLYENDNISTRCSQWRKFRHSDEISGFVNDILGAWEEHHTSHPFNRPVLNVRPRFSRQTHLFNKLDSRAWVYVVWMTRGRKNYHSFYLGCTTLYCISEFNPLQCGWSQMCICISWHSIHSVVK